MSRARRRRSPDVGAVRDEVVGFKRVVKAMSHLTAGNEILADVMRAFALSPEVSDDLPMSADEVQRWAKRFAEAAEKGLVETNAYLDVCKRTSRKRR